MARTTFFGTVRNSITNLMGGVRGYQNAAAWGVAFTTAYFLWIKPEFDLKREQEVCSISYNSIFPARFSYLNSLMIVLGSLKVTS